MKKDKINLIFGEGLRRLREALPRRDGKIVAQKVVAKEAGVGSSTYQRAEDGKIPGWTKLSKIAKYYGKSPNDLLPIEESSPGKTAELEGGGLETAEPVGPLGSWGQTRQHEAEGARFAVTLYSPNDEGGQEAPAEREQPQSVEQKEEPAPTAHTQPARKGAYVDTIDRKELALIRVLRLCGPEYAKRIYIASSIRAQNVIEERKLETEEKLKHGKDLEILSTASIE